MGKFEYIVNGVKEMVSEDNRDKVQEIFDKEFDILSKHFDAIYKDASDEQIELMKLSFVSFLLDKLINDNRALEIKSVTRSPLINYGDGIEIDHNLWWGTVISKPTILDGRDSNINSVSSTQTPKYTTSVMNCGVSGSSEHEPVIGLSDSSIHPDK